MYIGQQPVVGRYIKLDQISGGFNGTASGFTLAAGGQGVLPGTARNLMLSLGGVIQEPEVDFTISGSGLTFTTPPVSGTTFFAVVFGDMQSIGQPSDGTVIPASIASSGNFVFPNLSVTGVHTIASGSAAVSSLTITGDTDTGLFSPAANTLAVTTSGVERAAFGATAVVFNDGGADYDFRVEGDTDANLLFVDASTDRVGIGTSSPGAIFHTSQTSSGSSVIGAAIRNNALTASTAVSLDLSPSDLAPGVRSAQIEATNNGSNQINLAFKTSNGDVPATRMTLDHLGRLGIGTTSPGCNLEIGGTGHIHLADQGRVGCNSGSGAPQDAYVKFWDSDIIGFHTTDTERARIDSSGRLLVGTSSSIGGQSIQVGTSTGTLGLYKFANNDDGGELTLANSRNSTIGSHTVVNNNDFLGRIFFRGSDGSGFWRGAEIAVQVDGTPGTNSIPGRIAFLTTGSGDTVPSRRIWVNSAGQLRFDSTGGGGIIFENSGNRIFFGGPTNASVGTSSAGSGSTTLFIGNAAIQVSSDVRLKENIEDTKLDALDAINRIKVKDFTWNDPADTSPNNRNARGKWTGLIAQELVEILPFVVNAPRKEQDGSIDHDSEDRWTLDQSQLCPVLIKAVQQQQEIIASLEARLAALEAN